jgi:transcription elongation factor GreA
MQENYISQEGLEKLKEELKKLTSVRRPEIVERIANARDLGDLSENAEYHEAREDQSFVEGRVQELESLIKNAVIVSGDRNSKTVSMGATVHATCDNGIKMKYTVVGHSEANPAEGKISHQSPIGQAFLGRAVGEEVNVKIPSGVLKCKIDKIE